MAVLDERTWGGEFPPHVEWHYTRRAQWVAGLCVLRALADCGLVAFWREYEYAGARSCLVIEPLVNDIRRAAATNNKWKRKAKFYFYEVQYG